MRSKTNFINKSRSNRRGEYSFSNLKELCTSLSIILQITTSYTLQQNGVVERKNRILKDIANAMLLTLGLPQNLWGEVVLSTNYILDKVLHNMMGKTPYELWTRKLPFYNYLKVWKCLVKVAISPPKQTQLGT